MLLEEYLIANNLVKHLSWGNLSLTENENEDRSQVRDRPQNTTHS